MIKFFVLINLFYLTECFKLSRCLENLMCYNYPTDYTITSGRVLYPGKNGINHWDKYKISGPVVLPPNKNRNKWLMYYYGRDGTKWKGNYTAPDDLPTGYIGLVESKNGLNWNKVKGNKYKGSVLEPGEIFDNVHVSVSDVNDVDNKLLMFYSGGTEEKTIDHKTIGLRIRNLVAISNNTKDWISYKYPIVDINRYNSKYIFGSHVRVTPLDENNKNGKYIVTLHTLELRKNNTEAKFRIMGCVTEDRFGIYNLKNLDIILKEGEKDTWDCGGVSVRHIIKYDNIYYMFYSSEGRIDGSCKWCIGIAYSLNNGLTWDKLKIKDKKDLGGPVFEARYNLDAWDNYGVSCPYIIKKPDGNLRMYYLGIGKKEGNLTSAIGCAQTVNCDITNWVRV